MQMGMGLGGRSDTCTLDSPLTGSRRCLKTDERLLIRFEPAEIQQGNEFRT